MYVYFMFIFVLEGGVGSIPACHSPGFGHILKIHRCTHTFTHRYRDKGLLLEKQPTSPHVLLCAVRADGE